MSPAWRIAVVALVGAAAPTAHAAEATRVATAFEPSNRFDFHFGVAYDYNFKRADVLREWNAGTGGRTELAKDLIYRQQRHTLTPSLEIGLWRGLSAYAMVPIVLHDTRSYGFDQSADNCVFGGDVGPGDPRATCVNRDNSTTIRDEIIPRNGFDATDRSNPFQRLSGPNTEKIFQAPTRRGLDQVYVGLKYAVLNQDRHPHLPTWIVAFEGRFAAGKAMTMSRDIAVSAPAGNGRVGRRIHELGVWTSLSRRHRFLDPFVTVFWRQGLRANNGLFDDLSNLGAQERILPQSTTGIFVGTEIVPWERKARQQKVSLIVRGSAVLHYGGRGYSEVWELLADSPALVGADDPTRTADCNRTAALDYARENPGDRDYVMTGGTSCSRFGGVTAIQNYGTFGLNAAFNAHLGRYARLQIGANVDTDSRHFVTFTDRGKTNGSGKSPGLVDPGTDEVDPTRRDVVDSVGRRYAVDRVMSAYGYANFLFTF